MSTRLIRRVEGKYGKSVSDPIEIKLTPYLKIGGDQNLNIADRAKRLSFHVVSSDESTTMLDADSVQLYFNENDEPQLDYPALGLPIKFQKVHFRGMDGPNGSISEYFSYFLVSDPVEIVKSEESIVGAQYCKEDGQTITDSDICLSEDCEKENLTVSSWSGTAYDDRLIIGDSFRSFAGTLSEGEINACSSQDSNKTLKIPAVICEESCDPKDCETFSIGYVNMEDLSKFFLHKIQQTLGEGSKLITSFNIEDGLATWTGISIGENCEIYSTPYEQILSCSGGQESLGGGSSLSINSVKNKSSALTFFANYV